GERAGVHPAAGRSRERPCGGGGGGASARGWAAGGGGAPTGPGPSPGPRGGGEGGSVPAPSRRSWPRTPARPGSASVLLYASRRSSGYNVTMTFPATSRQTRTFDDRADALAHFFLRAGEAPRLLAYDDATGCPLDQALAALEWTAAVGILSEDDLIHAARLGAARSTQLLTGWFATGGAGVLFLPAQPGAPYSYHEVGIDI